MLRAKILSLLAVASLVFTGASCITFNSSTETGPMGTYRSADQGETWSQIAAYPTVKGLSSIAAAKVYKIFDDPSDPNAFYLGTRSQGLYYTYNSGDTWQFVPAMSGKFIYALAVDPSDKCTIYASDGTNIFKTEDCSRNWTTIFTEGRTTQQIRGLDIDPSDGSIWGIESKGDVMVSRDAGRSWTVVKRFDFDLQDLAVDKKQPGRVYVASLKKGLYRTDDNGVNWTDLRAGMKDFDDSMTFYRLYVNPSQDNSLFWISKYGIMRSDDAGATWKELKLLTPPGSVTIYAFATNPDNQKEIYYTGTVLGDDNVTHVRSTFYKSSDDGATWVTKKLPTNTIPVALKVHAKNTATLIMGFTVLK